jgi:hypothetical protein
MFNNDMKKAIEMITDRRAYYLNAEAYYEGIQSEVFPSKRWYSLLTNSEKYSRTDFRFNFARTVVDAVLNRLEVSNFITPSSDVNQQISDIWQMNDMQFDADEIHRRALVYGNCYAIVWTDSEGQITIDYNSPLTTVVIYDDENPRIKKYAAKLWQTEDPNDYTKKIARLNMYYPDRIEKYWMFGEIENVVSEGGFMLMETVDNPWGEVPVFHFRTSKQYGRPEHADAMGPQDAINKLIVTHMTTVDYQGAPQRYALSDNGNTAEFEDFDDDAAAEDNIGKLKNGPGELWYLKGISKVGEFSPADHKVFTEPVKDFVRSMASITNTPLHYFEKTGNVPSGEALRTAEAPLLKKVQDRQITFGSTWQDLMRFILRVEGVADYNAVTVKWNNLESMDSLDAWEVAVKKRVVGVSLEQVLIEMGYEPELAREIAAREDSLTNLSQNTNTNNVIMEATNGNVTDGTATDAN